MTAIEAHLLGKRYGRSWALRDCSLRLPAGQVAALVGPNGAGKSTLLHLAVGLLRPDAGTVRVLGREPGPGADVGFVAQETPLYADFTADELVRMGGKLNRRWEAAFARDRLDQLAVPRGRRVGRLSGGQRAQVALTLALAKRPSLLLLDEPVANLDPLARREFLQALMASVAEEGLTVLLSSHLLTDLERIADHLIVLRAGRTQVLGPVETLLAEHKVLVGPRRTPPAGATVVQESHTDKQSTVLVRLGGQSTVDDPMWTVHDVTLEELVLAYLGNPSAGALPGPAALPRGLRG